jgi:hypothetical protein
MNHAHCRSILALLLVVSIVIVGGLASAQAIAHESHHAHHQKATHASPFCSWMCAAGQVLDGMAVPPLVERAPVGHAHIGSFRVTPLRVPHATPSRGPPVL